MHRSKLMPRCFVLHGIAFFVTMLGVTQCSPAFAQNAIFPRSDKIGFGPATIAVGDFNGDGKPDMAVANQSNTIAILLNKGDGTYAPAVNYPIPGTTYIFAGYNNILGVGDFNGDHILDVITATRSTHNLAVFFGNGDGTFQSAATFPAGIAAESLLTGDFNGDGKPDVLLTNADTKSLSVVLSNGDGTFQAPRLAAGFTAEPFNLAAGDFNGDGKLDLIFTDFFNGAVVTVLPGNGDGTFGTAIKSSASLYSAQSIAVGDFNGDGKPDVVLGEFLTPQISVLLGKGDGTFQTAKILSVSSSATCVAVADMNGDGKSDIVAGENSGSEGSFHGAVILGNCDGTFQAEQAFNTGSNPFDVRVTDVDGDGKLDVLLDEYNSNSIVVLRGNGDGTLQPDAAYVVGVNIFAVPGLGSATDVAVGDFNGDGNLDFVTVSGTSANIVFGKGNGLFLLPVTMDVPAGAAYVAVGDLNRDGKPDIVVSGGPYFNPYSISVLLNNGNGTFQTPVAYTNYNLYQPGRIAIARALGITYVVVLNTGYDPFGHGGYILFSAASDGTLSSPGGASTDQYSGDLAIGDFRKDGRSDLVTGGDFFPDGAVSLSNLQRSPLGLTGPYAVGDFNGDSNLDLIAGYANGGFNLLPGNGDGTFQTALTFPADYGVPVPADFNRDSKLDLGVMGQIALTLFPGHGDGTFDAADTYSVGDFAITGTVGDFNNDGRPDFISVNRNSVSVLLNINGTPGIVSGVVTLEGRGPASSPVHVVLTLRPVNGGPDIVFEKDQGTISAFNLTNVPRQKYILHVKGAITLAANKTVDLSNGDVTGLMFTLGAGDANGDNQVDLADFGQLINAYGTDYLDPTGSYDEHTDFTGDGVIDLNDFALLVNNYGVSGDP